ncbi:MAG: hypothetical protein OXT72_01435 [Gammaproteobacteria bacterium]|nr:hypothetical protein [Gammaproteobacteria bacterium]MDE0246832.1 hypothetical protein [Gammaproteobacteria bacterium]
MTRPLPAIANGPLGSSTPTPASIYTGVLIVGVVGSGKTSACMQAFALQLLSWQAYRPEGLARSLLLEVKSDFRHSVRQMLD